MLCSVWFESSLVWQVTWWGRCCDARLKLRILSDRLLWILTRLHPASSGAVPEPCYISATLGMATDDGRWGWLLASGCGAENVVREWAMALVYRADEALQCNSDWLSYCNPSTTLWNAVTVCWGSWCLLFLFQWPPCLAVFSDDSTAWYPARLHGL